MESHKPVDKKAGNKRTAEAVLYAHKVRVGIATRRDHSSIDDERDEAKEHIQVEECENLLATDGSELGADVKNHDNRHEDGHDVHDGSSTLEDDGVGELDVARIAVGLDPNAARRHYWPKRRAQRQRRHLADAGEVTKARHDGGFDDDRLAAGGVGIGGSLKVWPRRGCYMTRTRCVRRDDNVACARSR